MGKNPQPGLYSHLRIHTEGICVMPGLAEKVKGSGKEMPAAWNSLDTLVRVGLYLCLIRTGSTASTEDLPHRSVQTK